MRTVTASSRSPTVTRSPKLSSLELGQHFAGEEVEEPRTPVKKAASAVKRHTHASSDPRPLEGYVGILASYAVLSGVLGLGLKSKKSRVRSLSPMDLMLYGLATEHLSSLITKDSVTAVLRSPFTRFKEAAGEGEVNEEVVGTGIRHAIGELVTCPFCAAQWVAIGLIAGSIALPDTTTALVSVSAVARTGDYLRLLYGLLRKDQ